MSLIYDRSKVEKITKESVSLLKELRIKRGWSQLETSERSNISTRTIQRIELNQLSVSQVHYFTLLKILSSHHFKELESYFCENRQIIRKMNEMDCE